MTGGERVAFTAIFNQCCAIPTRNAEQGLLGLDGEIEQRLRQLPDSAWRPPQQPSEVTCSLGPVVTWNNGYVFGNVVITNTSDHTITSWAIALDYAETPDVQQMYDYSYTYSGNRVVIKSAYPWSGTLLPGQTRHMAIQGSHDGSFTPPTCMGL